MGASWQGCSQLGCAASQGLPCCGARGGYGDTGNKRRALLPNREGKARAFHPPKPAAGWWWSQECGPNGHRQVGMGMQGARMLACPADTEMLLGTEVSQLTPALSTRPDYPLTLSWAPGPQVPSALGSPRPPPPGFTPAPHGQSHTPALPHLPQPFLLPGCFSEPQVPSHSPARL